VVWDGIERLLFSFAVIGKVEGVHGEFVSLPVVFGSVSSKILMGSRRPSTLGTSGKNVSMTS
jgi:hypothetical protein